LFTDKLEKIFQNVSKFVDEKSEVRDNVYPLIRKGIRLAALVIHALHNDNKIMAEENLTKLRDLIKNIYTLLSEHYDLLYSNFLLNLLQEYVEAELFYSVVVNNTILSPDELNVSFSAYLLGLSDLIGELRRRILILLNKKRIDEAKNLLKIMISIYDNLSSLEIPDSIVPGYKHKKDIARLIIDRTLSDMVITELTIKISSMGMLENETKEKENNH